MKRIITFLILVGMSLSAMLYAGCNGVGITSTTSSMPVGTTTATSAIGSDDLYYNETGLPIVKEPITLNILYPRQPYHGDFELMWFNTEILRLTNITLKYDLVEATGFEERKNLAFASGDYPDLFFVGTTKTDDMMYGPQGIIVNLSELVEKHAPVLSDLLADNENFRRMLTSPDGAIYSFPTYVDIERDLIRARPFFNKKWVDNLNLKLPTTLDELYEVLDAFKNDDPNQSGQADTIPLSCRYKPNYGVETYINAALGFVSRRHDIRNDTYHFVPMQPEYKEYLKYMNKLYANELLDTEYFTQDGSQLNAKVTELRVGMTDAGVNGLIADLDDVKQYIMLPALTSKTNEVPQWIGSTNELRGAGTFVMTDKCQYPEAAIKLLDFFFTQEGTRMVRVGPEYGKYEGIEGGWEIFTDESGKQNTRLHFEGFDGFWNFRGQHTPLNIPFFSSDDIIFLVIGQDPRNQFISDVVHGSGLLDIRRLDYPEIYFSEDEADTLAVIEADILSYIEEMDARFITGNRNIDDDWDNYIAEITRMGINEVISIRQEAYDRWNK